MTDSCATCFYWRNQQCHSREPEFPSTWATAKADDWCGEFSTTGIKEAAATITIGTVTKGATPSVTNVGTPTHAVLNFVLPQA